MVSTVSVCQSGCLPFLTHLQHFTSLSLHASALFPHLHPPQTPNPSALLEKTLHFMSLAPPHLSDKELVTLRPKQEVQLVISFWHETCVTLIRCSVFFFCFIFVFITVPLAVGKQESAVELVEKVTFSYRAHNLLCALYIFW